MLHNSIVATQLEFYKSGKAGCLFAAHAASDPKKYEWRLSVCDAVMPSSIETIVQEAIALSEVSTQSIIFPSIISDEDLGGLLSVLEQTPSVFPELEQKFKKTACLGFRVTVGSQVSWLTGFGGYHFLPKTRQSVFTEVVFRSNPRPQYEWVMKDTPENVLHLADMDMKGMRENKFKSLWYGSFDNTEKILGHKPDLRSAAKVTYAVPSRIWTSAQTYRR